MMHFFYPESGKKTDINFFISIISMLILFAFPLYAEESGDYIHYRLGVKYKNDKKYDQAMEEFRKVLAIYPDNYNTYMHMAEIRALQDQPRLVIYNLKKALNYNPGWGKAHKMLAASYERDGQYQKAIVELQQYQQSSDPAERDSLQQQIDRLISKVRGNEPVTSGASQTIESAVSGREPTDSLTATTVSSGKSPDTVKTQNAKPVKTNNPRVDSVFNTVVQLYEAKKLQPALDKIREILGIQPNHAGAYYYAGLIRYRMGQKKMARINFLKALDYPVQGYSAHYYLGILDAGEKKYKDAITYMTAFLSKTSYEPGKTEAKKLIEQYKSLLSEAKQVSVEKKPSEPIVKDENQNEATFSVQPIAVEKYAPLEIQIDSMLSMLTIDTLTDAGQKLLSGIKEFRGGNFDKAILEFKKVLIESPSGNIAVFCIYNTGVSYFKMNLFKDAENQFQQILDRFASHSAAPKALFLKALAYQYRHESSIAEKLLRDFLQKHRNHAWAPIAFERLGDCYVELEQHRKAIDAYSQALQKNSNAEKVQILYKTGTLYLQLGNNTRAIESFNNAIATGEKNEIFVRVPDCYYRVADIHYKNREYQKALDMYVRVTRKYPAFQETPWGYFQIGSIYKNTKQYQNAVNAFRDLIRKYPEDYWAKQAQWKLEDTIWENEYKAVLN